MLISQFNVITIVPLIIALATAQCYCRFATPFMLLHARLVKGVLLSIIMVRGTLDIVRKNILYSSQA